MLVNIENINKFYSQNHLLKSVSLTIEDNERIGLVGVNGCGKTTLLRILTGAEGFDNIPGVSGSISISAKTAIGYLKQDSGLDKNCNIQEEMQSVFENLYSIQARIRELEAMMTLEENIADEKKLKEISAEYSKASSFFEANEGYLIDVKINTILNGMGFENIDRSLNITTLSGGEKTRLAMAKLLLENPSLLILDEPTNHLDFKTLEWLEEYLRNYRGSLLIVSHDRYFLDRLCTRICEIENGSLTSFKGDYSAYLIQKEMLTERQAKEFEQQQSQIAQLQEYIDKNKARASTANMAKSRQAALDRMELVEKPQQNKKPPRIKLEYDIIPPKEVLKVSNLEVSVGDGDGVKELISSIDFTVRRGEKLAFIGSNGIGKSTILKLILGKNKKRKGQIEWSDNVKASYFDQENAQININNTVIEEIHRRYPRETEQTIRNDLAKVLLTGENVFKPVQAVSGGERAKLCFAILMKERGNVLVLDEPTNHLDLSTKEVLEDALDSFDGTIIFVSHDRYLLNKIATRIIEIKEDSFREFSGNFDFYSACIQQEEKIFRQKEDERKFQMLRKEQTEKNTKSYKTKDQRSNEVKIRNRIKELEASILELEEQQALLEQDLANPQVFSDHEIMAEKCREIEYYKEKISACYDEWAELSEG